MERRHWMKHARVTARPVRHGLLRHPRALVALTTVIVGFGVFSSAVGTGALPTESLPAFGVTNGEGSLSTVAELGDINGDGLGDYAVGLPSAVRRRRRRHRLRLPRAGGRAVVDPDGTQPRERPRSRSPATRRDARVRDRRRRRQRRRPGRHRHRRAHGRGAGQERRRRRLRHLRLAQPATSPRRRSRARATRTSATNPLRRPRSAAATTASRSTRTPACPGWAAGRQRRRQQRARRGLSRRQCSTATAAAAWPCSTASRRACTSRSTTSGRQRLSVLLPHRLPRPRGQHIGMSVASVGDMTGDGPAGHRIRCAGGRLQRARRLRLGLDRQRPSARHGRRLHDDAACDRSLPVDQAQQPHAGQGYRIDGAAPGDQLGTSLAGVGDQNGDGIRDLAIGAAGASPQRARGLRPGRRRGRSDAHRNTRPGARRRRSSASTGPSPAPAWARRSPPPATSTPMAASTCSRARRVCPPRPEPPISSRAPPARRPTWQGPLRSRCPASAPAPWPPARSVPARHSTAAVRMR